MMLRLEVYTAEEQQRRDKAPALQNDTLRPDHVWHVSPGCCGTRSETLLTVGRKQSDLNFGSDKSISRSHCFLRLGHQDGAKVVLNAGKAPETEDEAGACWKAADGVVAVVHDVGSRYGTFVVVQDFEEEEEDQDDEQEDKEATEEDATDDEMPGSSTILHPGPALSSSAAVSSEGGMANPESSSQVASSEAMSQAVWGRLEWARSVYKETFPRYCGALKRGMADSLLTSLC